jgi:hypothetical protein
MPDYDNLMELNQIDSKSQYSIGGYSQERKQFLQMPFEIKHSAVQRGAGYDHVK